MAWRHFVSFRNMRYYTASYADFSQTIWGTCFKFSDLELKNIRIHWHSKHYDAFRVLWSIMKLLNSKKIRWVNESDLSLIWVWFEFDLSLICLICLICLIRKRDQVRWSTTGQSSSINRTNTMQTSLVLNQSFESKLKSFLKTELKLADLMRVGRGERDKKEQCRVSSRSTGRVRIEEVVVRYVYDKDNLSALLLKISLLI